MQAKWALSPVVPTCKWKAVVMMCSFYIAVRLSQHSMKVMEML